MFLPFLFLLCAGAAADAAPAPNARPCAAPSTYPFCDDSLPIAARARALVSSLTLDEKIAQLSNTAGGVPRLGIPPYQWWSESLHGLADNGPGVNFSSGPVRAATAFPQVILTTAAFNRSLWRAVAEAVAVEARAMHNAGQAGLTYWAPNINIFRDPRWGRGQETSGEDPAVAAAYSVEYVKGFQGESGNDGRIRLSACCKHYTAYDMEKWEGFNRYTFNAKVTEQDLEDTYQPPFKSCIQEGRASCLMCAYNQVNGVPMCARKDLLQKTRDEWGFQGYITSDCDAVAIIHENQTYTSSDEDSVAIVLKAGMDLNCGSFLVRHTKSAVEKGKVKEKDIDRALFNLFSVHLRLGIFDKTSGKQLFSQLGPNDICTKEHRELAADAARQGTVLLKNDNSFLPLKTSEVRHIAIIGPSGNDAYAMGGDYTGVSCDPTTFFKGMRSYVMQTTFATGCKDVPCNSSDGFSEAVEASRNADIVVLVAGLNLTEESEDRDRVSLLLPGKQMDLINSVASVTKKPIVLVLLGGGPVDVSFAKHNPQIGSILWMGYPGETGGQVLPEIIFGKYNPGAKLPLTWYPESFTAVPMTDMNMRSDPSRGYPGRTYRFYTGPVVYSFGYGLSYSTYSYSILQAPKKISLSHSSNPVIISRKAMNSLQSFLAVAPVSRPPAAGAGARSRRSRVSACLPAPPPPPSPTAARGAPRELSAASRAVVEDEARYLVGTYNRSRVVIVSGRRCKLYDADGREYLDLAAGIAVSALGHADPDLVAVSASQAGTLVHISNTVYSRPQVELAKRLVEASFADRAFLANSGTEANEAAIKFARKFQRAAHPGGGAPVEFLAFSNCFHGRTMGALALTSKSQYREPFEPVMPGVTFAEYGNLEEARKVVQSGKIAAVFVEPVQGEGGIHSATKEFLQGLRDACDEAGALLVFDEVQCGLGRTGYLWAHEAYGVTPDMMTLAKPLANGYPIGAVLLKEKVAAAIGYGDHGTTYGGNPFVCQAAITVFDKISEPGFLAEVSKKGENFKQLLRTTLSGNPHVKEVRGMGLIVGIELDVPAAPLVNACLDAGVMVLTAGKGNVVRLVPPLIISEKELEYAAHVISDCLPALDVSAS